MYIYTQTFPPIIPCSADTVHVKKNATICKICATLLIRNCATLLWFVGGAPGYGIAAIFAKHATIRRTCCIFMERHNSWILVLYKTAHCDATIKVLRFWREKSGTHAAMYSSAAVARTCMLHSF